MCEELFGNNCFSCKEHKVFIELISKLLLFAFHNIEIKANKHYNKLFISEDFAFLQYININIFISVRHSSFANQQIISSFYFYNGLLLRQYRHIKAALLGILYSNYYTYSLQEKKSLFPQQKCSCEVLSTEEKQIQTPESLFYEKPILIPLP